MSITPDKNSLNREPGFPGLSRFRLIAGVVTGLLYSVALYSLLYLTRETFRILSVDEYYDLWILADQEVAFYNLIFAFIAFIMGQSVCFTFWIDRPQRMFGKENRRKTAIVNDQRVLNWYFLSWFSKLAVVFGIMFGLAFHDGYLYFNVSFGYKQLLVNNL